MAWPKPGNREAWVLEKAGEARAAEQPGSRKPKLEDFSLLETKRRRTNLLPAENHLGGEVHVQLLARASGHQIPGHLSEKPLEFIMGFMGFGFPP